MQAITTIGLDIAKSVFQVHGIDAEDKVIIRRQPAPTHSLTGKPNINARYRLDRVCPINEFVAHHLNCGRGVPQRRALQT